MKSQYAGSCLKNPDHKWNVGDEIFLSKDGQGWIKCTDKDCFLSQGGKIQEGGKKPFTPNKFPITEAEQIYNKAEAILDSFIKKRTKPIENPAGQTQGDPVVPVMEIGDQSVFILSMFRTLSGNFKP